jgi:transcriptional regulator with XRE-family HTH domain
MNKTIYVPAYRRLVGELRQARRRAGLTQTDAGRKLGKSRQWIHLVESCQVRLDVVQVCCIARICGVRAHELVRQMEAELPEEGDSSYVSDLGGVGLHVFLSVRHLWVLRTAGCTVCHVQSTRFVLEWLSSVDCGADTFWAVLSR